MQFRLSLPFVITATLALTGAATPTDVYASIITPEQFKHWLATTDANITYIGEPIEARDFTLGARATTMVTYCSSRSQNVCGGACTVYNGGPTCLSAPNTQCLAATRNIAFCSTGNCNNPCNQLASCGTPLDNGFCWTPGTNSIIVGA